MSLVEITVTFSAAFIGSVMGGATLLVLRRADWLREEPVWLVVEYKQAPSDILRYIQPGTSVANMRKRLGAPVAETKTNFKYRYKNLYLEIDSEDGTTIDSVTLVLPSVADSDTFEVHPINNLESLEQNFVLGETRIEDVMEKDEELETNVSSKSESVAVTKYYGNPGYYQSYVFGVFDGPSAQYDGPETTSTIRDDPAGKVINYVEITREHLDDAAVAHFDFYTFRKLSE